MHVDDPKLTGRKKLLGAQWIWEDAARPLRAKVPGWEPHEAAPGIRLFSRGGGGS